MDIQAEAHPHEIQIHEYLGPLALRRGAVMVQELRRCGSGKRGEGERPLKKSWYKPLDLPHYIPCF